MIKSLPYKKYWYKIAKFIEYNNDTTKFFLNHKMNTEVDIVNAPFL